MVSFLSCIIFISALFIGGASEVCLAQTSPELPQSTVPSTTPSIPAWMLGNWKLIGYFYHGELRPPLNPNLILVFQFNADGSDDLYWSRVGEVGFCERKGRFNVTGNIYNDEVLSTNPRNAMNCGEDADMQVGKKTSTEIDLTDGRFRLNIGLSGEPFYYVFESTPDFPGPK